MQTHRPVPSASAPTLPPQPALRQSLPTPRPLWTLAGRFAVLETLESRAGGQVFEARDLRTDQVRRLFVARADAAEQRAVLDAAVPRHRHLVGPAELGTWGGLRFCVLEREVQPSLRSLLELIEGRLPQEHVARMGRQACLGLAELHAAGYSHGALTTGVLRVDPWTMETRVAGWSFRLPRLPRDPAADLRTLGAILARAHTGEVPGIQEPDLHSGDDLALLLGRMMRGDGPVDAATLARWFGRLERATGAPRRRR